MKQMFSELIQCRHLLFELTLRDIKIRYKQSVMGFMWAIFMPMMVVAAGIMVKKAFSILSGKPMDLSQIASISVKSVPWAFFVGSIRFATGSLLANVSLVTKVYFPREVLPMASVVANFFDFMVACVVLAVILAVAGVGTSIYLCWLPAILILLVLLSAGLGLLLSCANLFFRDVKYIVEVILTFGIFFTPVFYEVDMFGNWAPILLLNPMGPILESIRTIVVLHQPPSFYWLGYSAIWSVVGFLGAWTTFHRLEHAFAENI